MVEDEKEDEVNQKSQEEEEKEKPREVSEEKKIKKEKGGNVKRVFSFIFRFLNGVVNSILLTFVGAVLATVVICFLAMVGVLISSIFFPLMGLLIILTILVVVIAVPGSFVAGCLLSRKEIKELIEKAIKKKKKEDFE